jgi:predicted MFS family arabinose efflux permease
VKGAKAAVLLGLPCAILAGLAYLASAFAAAIPLASLAVLLVGRALLGVAESLFMTGGLTWGIARVGPGAAGRAMAQQGIAMYAALGVGAPIGLALYQAHGFALVSAAVIVLPMIGCAIALSQHHPERAAAARRGGSFLKVVGMIWPMGLGLALGTTSYAAMAGFLPLFFTAHHWGGAGLALSAFAVFYIGVRLFLAHLPDKVGGSHVAVASLLVIVVGQLALWAAPSQAVAIAGTAVTGAGYSLLFPSFGVQAMRRAPPEVRGLAVGAFMAFFDVALGVAGPLCGVVAGRYGYGAVFLIGAVAAACSVVLTLSVQSRARPASLAPGGQG